MLVRIIIFLIVRLIIFQADHDVEIIKEIIKDQISLSSSLKYKKFHPDLEIIVPSNVRKNSCYCEFAKLNVEIFNISAAVRR